MVSTDSLSYACALIKRNGLWERESIWITVGLRLSIISLIIALNKVQNFVFSLKKSLDVMKWSVDFFIPLVPRESHKSHIFGSIQKIFQIIILELPYFK